MDQCLTYSLDQLLTYKHPNLGPVFSSTAYIYISIFLSLSLSLSVSITLFVGSMCACLAFPYFPSALSSSVLLFFHLFLPPSVHVSCHWSFCQKSFFFFFFFFIFLFFFFFLFLFLFFLYFFSSFFFLDFFFFFPSRPLSCVLPSSSPPSYPASDSPASSYIGVWWPQALQIQELHDPQPPPRNEIL